jgi:hypothetical protein
MNKEAYLKTEVIRIKVIVSFTKSVVYYHLLRLRATDGEQSIRHDSIITSCVLSGTCEDDIEPHILIHIA